MSGRLIDAENLKNWIIGHQKSLYTQQTNYYHCVIDPEMLLLEIQSGRLDAQSPTPGQDGLMPCPLPACGGEAGLRRHRRDQGFEHSIECSECGICLSVASVDTKPPQSLFNIWNTRAPSPTQPEKENERKPQT